jgi:Uma2 family endonuclease
MASATELWTVERVHALPDDGRRYEVIDGELYVTPAPTWRHQRAVFELAYALRVYLEKNPVGDVLIAPADVDFDRVNLVQPDVFVAPRIRGLLPRDFHDAGRLLLAIEVPSPGTARTDRKIKRALYQGRGVDYWIVDLESRAVEYWRPAAEMPETVTGELRWSPAGTEPFLLDLPSFFASIGDR